MNISNITNKILKLNTSKKFNLKNKMGIKLAALALALGIGTFSLVSQTNDTLTVGVTKDIAEDSYKESIPIFSDENGKVLLTTIDNNRLIITQDNVGSYSSEDKLHLVSVLNEDNMVTTGYTYKKYMDQLTEIAQENASFLYKVSAKNGLILRETAEISDNKLTNIPQNSILIGAKPQENEYNWTNVVYFNGSNINKGFASGKFLEQIFNTNEHFRTIDEKNIDIFSAEHNEFGIDVSHIRPNVLDKLLQGKIKLPDNPIRTSGKRANLSQFDKDIKFVYIKALGTAPFAKELKRGKDTPYIELAKICEKNKVPFGFYFYSTCTTKEEAKLEYKWFSEVLNKIKDNPYHLLPVAIDVEVANNKDRQRKASVKNLTDSKIHLANLLENDFGKTILYTPRNAYSNKLESKILDLEQYQNGLNSGNCDIWHVTSIESLLHKKSLLSIAKHVTANQIALDVKVDDNINNLVDINLMNKNAFNNYISGKYISENRKDNSIPSNKIISVAQADELER